MFLQATTFVWRGHYDHARPMGVGRLEVPKLAAEIDAKILADPLVSSMARIGSEGPFDGVNLVPSRLADRRDDLLLDPILECFSLLGIGSHNDALQACAGNREQFLSSAKGRHSFPTLVFVSEELPGGRAAGRGRRSPWSSNGSSLG
jgi:hypothetical protein